MEGALIVAIVFGGVVLALAIIGSTIFMVVKVLKGGLSRRDQKAQTEETKVFQEMHQGLSRMEERVEALEEILLDAKRKDRGS
jgi:phage shock protein B